MPPRLTAKALTQHLLTEEPSTRSLVRSLRATVLATVPACAEAMKFHALCYFNEDAYFGSIGGNICFIEIKQGKVYLSFIFGALLQDSARLLTGKGKFKRFLHIPDRTLLKDPELTKLIRQAAKLRPFEDGTI